MQGSLAMGVPTVARRLHRAADMVDARHELGSRIEDAAALWWERRGARVIARNYRRKTGEIDLIVEERSDAGGVALVFVEVRARRQAWGEVSPVSSVTWAKRQKLRRTAEQFLARYAGTARSVRFDLMAWEEGLGFKHLPGAWHY